MLHAHQSDTSGVATPLSRLSIVVFPESKKAWTARSLERDIAAAGRTPEAAVESLLSIAEAHIAFDARHGRDPLSSFTTAPQLYWKAFAQAERESKPREVRRFDSKCNVQYLVGMVPDHPIVARYHASRIA
jgi:hypothetical protein